MAKKNELPEIIPSGRPAKKTKKAFPIVGMGASAGGLEAFESFFKAMPANSGMAFVLVSHLDPTHVSILPELIQKKTLMKVTLITDGLPVKPDRVYAIPPNKDLAILNGTLHLMDQMHPRGLNLPIDNFFKSLAQDQGDNAIGIILSGTGTDGTLGLKQIKAELGMVMVQDTASAKYAGMPRSAVATGLVDYVLDADQMPEQLIKYTKHAILEPKAKITSDEDKFQMALQKIYILLRSHTGQDFSLYKKNTITRRIERRMHVHQIDDVLDYVKYLQASDREVHVLFKDLLIGVTGFFRDPEAFDALKEMLLSGLLRGKPNDSAVRVWVAGCSTGEEAYSIAILLHECSETLNRHFDVQIFGTDIDKDAINTARTGLYPLSISGDVSPERLQRFFTSEESHFQIKKSIREMLVFAPQNLIKDPPFTKLDILSCRNLMIYLGSELQKKLFPVFHYSLKPEGILFLGSSESLGQAGELFRIQDKKWKIFSPQPTLTKARPVLDFPILASSDDARDIKCDKAVKRAEEINSFMLVETILQQSDTPPCAIIDEKSDIVYTHGRTGKYLEPAIGKASINILEMARPGLKAVLAAAIRKVSTLKREVVHKAIDVENNGGILKIDLIVKPVLEYGAIRGMLMVIFHDATPKTGPIKIVKTQKNKSIIKLEQELQYTRENLQTTIEELETANEELKSTNEELQSTNEELQSTNEELETSKEELQSLNEESATVNTELQSRIDQLSDANDDMKNLLDSTQIGTIFLDIDLNVRRFTNMVVKLIPLTSMDIGRPIKHFSTELKNFNIDQTAQQVLKDLVTREIEVESGENTYFRTRIMPYRTMHNVIDGVVITFEDITELKQSVLTTQRLSVIMNSKDAVIIQDKNGNINFWNQGAQKLYGYTQESALKMNIRDMVPEDRVLQSRTFTQKAFRGDLFKSMETDRKALGGDTIRVWLMALALRDETDKINGLVTIERAITDFPEKIKKE
ncbi:MAG: PAS domain-containing protein [Proteobacteria bacterium]|nr:PAS domain S-box protein [Desulfobacula sp.]MBU3951845.1 PAS domain-containing protein [Pseudomonadota bacterium]MBU4130685.1 PAS domain-containing protein [Pseudomonadota bacterium]